MAKRQQCPDCRGLGTIDLKGQKTKCFACGGKGFSMRTGQRTCPPCRGTGKISLWKQCERCQGAGYISVQEE